MNSQLKKDRAVATSNDGILIKKMTRANHSDTVDAKALRITLSPKRLVNINARIHQFKKVNPHNMLVGR